jgi:hypothetical protein
MWIFVGATLIAFFAMFIVHASHSIENIQLNWNQYRCHPAYMPFAGTIRPDVSTSENMYYCFGAAANQFYKPILDSLNGSFSNVSASISEVSGSLPAFRGVFSMLRKTMLSFAASTFSKITNSTSTFTTYVIKIRDVLQRFSAQGYIGSFLASTAMDFILSFVYFCINVIKIFAYSILAISILLIFAGQVEFIILATAIVAAIGASGF